METNQARKLAKEIWYAIEREGDEDKAVELLSLLYERGLREGLERAAKEIFPWFESWRPCDCGAPKSKYNTQCGHAMNCEMYTALELAASIRQIK